LPGGWFFSVARPVLFSSFAHIVKVFSLFDPASISLIYIAQARTH
jgi:hypothetical protein